MNIIHFYKKTFMNNRILKILGISDADENNDALSNRIRKKLEEAENHPVDAGKSLYEYDRNGETVFARIEKFTDETEYDLVRYGRFPVVE